MKYYVLKLLINSTNFLQTGSLNSTNWIIKFYKLDILHTRFRHLHRLRWVGGNRSKERDQKSELVLKSTYQIIEWDRNNSNRKRSQISSHTPSALNAGAKRSGATCHMAMPQCCYLAKGSKRPSHTTNTIKFDRIPFDPRNSIKSFNLCPFDQKNSTYLQPPA